MCYSADTIYMRMGQQTCASALESARARTQHEKTRNKVLQSDAQTIYCEAMQLFLPMVLNSHKTWTEAQTPNAASESKW